jgi:hypothetical protein
LIPILILLLLKALEHYQLNLWIAFIITGLLAAFAIGGTRDALLFHETNWKLAQKANELGMENIHLDAGAPWTAMQHFEATLAEKVPIQTPAYAFQSSDPDALIWPAPPWWIGLWGRRVDSIYVIAGEKLSGFIPISQAGYDSWLLGRPVYLYLLKRP